MAEKIKTSLYEPVTLEASAAHTATGTGTAMRLPKDAKAVIYIFDLTAAATDAADTLDVKIQTKLDKSQWFDVVHFTQVLGNGAGDFTYVAKISAADGEGMFEIGTALAAGEVRSLIGEETRAVWTIVDSGDADQTFTFSVYAIPV